MSSASPGSKDPNIALAIEIVAGYLGFLGIGYLYVGRTTAGLLRLFGWWAFMFGAVFGTAVLSAFLPEFGDGGVVVGLMALLCLVPTLLAIPTVSGLMLKRSMRRQQG